MRTAKREITSLLMFIATLENERLAGGNRVTIPSMVDFRCREYSDGEVVADKETRDLIVKMGIRKVARLTGIHSDTITRVANGMPVKPSTLAKVVAFLRT